MNANQLIVADTNAWDVPRLSDASLTVRIECADAFAAEYAGGNLSANERRAAEIVLKQFIEDSVEEVRAAIARHVVACPFLPKSLAIRIAADVDSIAVPMIRLSEVFDDEDLLAIIRSGVVARQVAVASRKEISQEVAGALVGTGNSRVITTLLANDGADIDEDGLVRVLDKFGDDPSIRGVLVGRANLPLTILNRMLRITGIKLGNILEDRLEIPAPISRRISRLAHEQLTVDHARECQNVDDVTELARRLNSSGQLTSTLVLRALCTGDVQFFGICLAVKSGGNVDAIHFAIQSCQFEELRKYYFTTDWPESLHRAFMIVLDEYAARKDSPIGLTPEVFASKAVKRLVREYHDVSPGELDVVLAEICWRHR